MPKLPTEQDVQRVGVRPDTSVASYNAGQMAQVQTRIGRELEAIGEQEIQKLDTLKATEAETALMQSEVQLEAEYKQAKNGDVLNPEYHKLSQQKYKDAAVNAAKVLVTPAQKQRFNQLTQQRAARFDAGRMTHAMQQAEAYEGAVFEARVATLVDQGANSYKDPAKLSATALELEGQFVTAMTRKGLSDPAILTNELGKVRSKYWGATIERALTDGDTTAANALFATAGRMLTDEQRQVFGKRLDSSNALEGGAMIAETALKMSNDGASAQDIELFIAKEAGANKEMYNSAQTVLTNIQQRQKTVTDEAVGSLILKFQEKGANFSAMKTVQSSAEFAALSPKLRGDLLDDMLSDARSTQTYNMSLAREARQAQKEKYDTLENYAKFDTLVNSDRFATMSTGELMAYKTVLGTELTKMLIKTQNEVKTEGKKFSIDKDILNDAVPEELRKDKNKDKLYAFRGVVEETLQGWKTQNPGKIPTLAEQRTIARSALQEYTVKGKYWGQNTYKAYETPSYNTSEAEVKRSIITEASAMGRDLTPAQVDKAYRAYLKDQQ
jgi:hypothetical protein